MSNHTRIRKEIVKEAFDFTESINKPFNDLESRIDKKREALEKRFNEKIKDLNDKIEALKDAADKSKTYRLSIIGIFVSIGTLFVALIALFK